MITVWCESSRFLHPTITLCKLFVFIKRKKNIYMHEDDTPKYIVKSECNLYTIIFCMHLMSTFYNTIFLYILIYKAR